MAGSLSLRLGLAGADIIRPLSPSLRSKLPYAHILRASPYLTPMAPEMTIFCTSEVPS